LAKADWPDCGVDVIGLVENEPVFNFQIAHIAALNQTGARHQSEMSDKERNSFGNLILLCSPHHQYVDQIKPQDFSIARL
jgi:hypothetical protein